MPNKRSYETVAPAQGGEEPDGTLDANGVNDWKNWSGGRNDAATDNLAWTGLGALAGGVAGHAFKAPVLGAALGGTAGAVGSSIATKREAAKAMHLAKQLRQILEARNRVALPAGQFKLASSDGPLADLDSLPLAEAAANLQRYQAELQLTKQANISDYLPTSLAGQTALGAGVGGVLGAGAGLIGERGRDSHRRNYLRAALMGSLGGGALGAGAGALYNLGSAEYRDAMTPKLESANNMRAKVQERLDAGDYAGAAKLNKALIDAYGAGVNGVDDHAVPAVIKATLGGLTPYIPDTRGASENLTAAGTGLGVGAGLWRNKVLRNQVDVSDTKPFDSHVDSRANINANAAAAKVGPAPTSKAQVMAENAERLAEAHRGSSATNKPFMSAVNADNAKDLAGQQLAQDKYDKAVTGAKQPILDQAAKLKTDVQNARKIPGSTYRKLVNPDGKKINLTLGQRANLPHAAGGKIKQTMRVGKYGLGGMTAGWLGSMLSDTLHTPTAQQQFDAAKANL